jgi:hypothetical protein
MYLETVLKGSSLLLIGIIMPSIFNVGFVKDNHFNLITVNSVFIGFLFTSLSIMLSFLDRKIVKLFEKAGCLKQVYGNITKGIFYSIASITISIMDMLFIEKIKNMAYNINVFYSLEVLLLIVTLILLTKSMLSLKTIVESIRIEQLQESETEDANKEMERIFDQSK